MPSASTLAATTIQTPSGHIVLGAPQSSALNFQFFSEIPPETLRPFPDHGITDFKNWLQTIPFQFDEIHQTIHGRYLDNEADVRMFLEPALALAC